MALKGWRLKSISLGWILKYERIEPQKLYYTVELIGSRSKNPEEVSKKDLFTEFHWNYVCGNGIFTVYVSENSVPGEKAVISRWNTSVYLGGIYLLFLFVTGLSLYIVKQNYLDFVANTFFLLIPATVAAFFAKAGIGTVYCVLERKRKKSQRAVCVKPWYIRTKNLVSLIPSFIVLAALVFSIIDANLNKDFINLQYYVVYAVSGFMLLFFAVISVRSILRREVSITAIALFVIAGIVSVYYFVVEHDYYVYKDEYSDYEIVVEGAYIAKLYRDNLPLTMADFDIAVGKYDSNEFYEHRNALVSYKYYEERAVENLWDQQSKLFYYEVFTGNNLFIDGYLSWELSKEQFTRTDNPEWGAKAVYEESQYPYRRVAVYDGKVIVISCLEEINSRQIERIKEKL